jgi:hypothetical protein
MSPIPIPGGFADVEDAFEPVPAGTYDAVVFKGELREAGPQAKNPGSSYIAWEFNLLDPGYERRKAWLNTSLVPAALPMLKRFLLAVGLEKGDLDAADYELDINEIEGRQCRLVIVAGTNPNTGEVNHSVKRVLPPGATETVLP